MRSTKDDRQSPLSTRFFSTFRLLITAAATQCDRSEADSKLANPNGLLWFEIPIQFL